MPLNPPRIPTKRETAVGAVRTTRIKAEGYLYLHAPVIAAFLAGAVVGYIFGGS